MQDFLDQLLPAAITILAGVAVYVGGQFAVKLFLEPIQELGKLTYRIATDFTFYKNMVANGFMMTKEQRIELIDKFRRHASDLRAYVWTLRWYWLWEKLRLVRPKADMLKASGELIGYSNSVSSKQNVNLELLSRRENTIMELFGFDKID